MHTRLASALLGATLLGLSAGAIAAVVDRPMPGSSLPLIEVADGQAAPGSTVATGVGATTVTIGGIPVQVLFSGLAPGFVGLWQINVLLPENLPTNAATSLRVTKSRTGGETTLAVVSRNEYGTVSGKVTDALSGGTTGSFGLYPSPFVLFRGSNQPGVPGGTRIPRNFIPCSENPKPRLSP